MSEITPFRNNREWKAMLSAAYPIIICALAACLLFLGSCGGDRKESAGTSAPPASAAKEKYFRGNIVSHKADGRRGVVIGKRYIQGSDGTAHDVWTYRVRIAIPESLMPNRSSLSLYVEGDFYEFELDPVGPATPEKQ